MLYGVGSAKSLKVSQIYLRKNVYRGQKNSTVGKVLAFYVVDLGLNPGIPYELLSASKIGYDYKEHIFELH